MFAKQGRFSFNRARVTESEDHCECRVCPWFGPRVLLAHHLESEHGMDKAALDALTARLHRSKDTPEYSENTLGFYQGERLLFIIVQRRWRAADDPMRY